ncbi:MAG: hypothetical protein WCC57_05055 [Paracoccaceae bacterium]
MRRLLMILALLSLAACQLALPGKPAGPKAAAATGAITGDAITVTALDGGTSAAANPAAPAATGPKPKPRPSQPANQPASQTPAKPPLPGQPAKTADPPQTDVPAPVIAPPVVKSATQLACERKGGRYASVGDSSTKTCVRPTRDGGKQCRKESDCEGACLARSHSCAPFSPLIGCNEILQDDGFVVTLCID